MELMHPFADTVSAAGDPVSAVVGFFRALANQLGAVKDYIGANRSDFDPALRTHLQLSIYSILLGIALCLPLGVLASRNRYVSLYSLNGIGILRAVPSIAVLFLAYPYLGLGFKPALLALTVLACPPILVNTTVGFREVDPAIREAAYGMGMNTLQVLGRVELPLAVPVVLAGIRTASVEVVASASLATFIGGGGLGIFINEGLRALDPTIILVGALPIALMTLGSEVVLGSLEFFTRRRSAA